MTVGENAGKTANSIMDAALAEAKLAETLGEVPIGAVITHNGAIIARAGNRTRTLNDPTAHAEILAIRMACELLNSPRITDCDLYVSLEPCAMCAGAISYARIRRLYYGAADEKGGAVDHGPRFFHQPTCFHAPDVYSGFAQSQSSELLKAFFERLR
ncbi:MAG: nucleoside deaminase [Notoacmeibacter sp.]